jgi:RHS repeat-associated protein
MAIQGRKYTSSSSYRYGFNGKENDNETVGAGEGTQDFGMRIYNPSLGRWMSIDPLVRKYPDWSPYKSFRDNPIIYQDPDGADEFLTIIAKVNGKMIAVGMVKTSEKVYSDNKIQLIGNGGTYYNEKQWFDKSKVIVREYDTEGKLIGETTTESLLPGVRATTSGPVINSQNYATFKASFSETDGYLNERYKKIVEEIEEEYGGGGARKENSAPTKNGETNVLLFLIGEIADPVVNDENYYPNVDNSRATTPEQTKTRTEGDTVIKVYGDGETNSYYGAATINSDGSTSSVGGEATKKQVDTHGAKPKK